MSPEEGKAVEYEALVVDYAGTFTDEGMAEVVADARGRGLKTALLSNADHRPRGLPDVFDAVVVSGEVGVAKPDKGIYLHAARVLGVDPSRCVFIDDVPGYVRGAVLAGMTGIRHTSTQSTLDELAVLRG
ncbi:HAD-IA family hydrolase [Actinokineospora pegani]|uniref:HAD-IA family hydrolase n=1 Tax=Actinokineospora pegani TaxID=2654637 RepID=UPI001F228342|nr:HAD-IA family hydrolase [Actinokineospora pegani]